MDSIQQKTALISGASFAGLSTAYWMHKLGYKVTVVEISKALKKGGTPVDIRGNTVDIVTRMGILDQVKANRLPPKMMEFKNAEDVTEGCFQENRDGQTDHEEYEIERDTLLSILFDQVKNNVEFIFNESIVGLQETDDHVEATFKNGPQRTFDLVFGCDGIHSIVRKIWFGHEDEFVHFLEQYFSITIVNKLLIKDNTAQMYNVPDKAIMLNSYNNKTDIVLCFRTGKEIEYDYRNEEQQRQIIMDQFAGGNWRTAELLEEVQRSETFYFDKLCQVKMPSWTKGRVALVGDAGYCASPAAGMGGSLAIDGAAALADAFQKHNGNITQAFETYNTNFRPFIEEVQAAAVNVGLEMLVPRTEEAIRKRNEMTAFI
jgi:2-polyprenyl-6-methoxyphenol hydroxylase-like FAD-dependent oxidoreductase